MRRLAEDLGAGYLRAMRLPALLLAAPLLATACEDKPSTAGAANQTQASPTASADAGPAFWRLLADRWVAGNPIPDFELTDHEGRAFQLSELAGDHVLVGLIFTHCSVPEACPRTTRQMLEVGTQWKKREKRDGVSLRLLTLTFDPTEDTPAVLKAYSEGVRSQVPDWIFATGPTELMEDRLPAMFGVIARKKDDDGNIAHGVKAVLLGPGLQPLKTWTDNAFTPADVFAVVER